jgi:hypothetical protein
MLSTRQGAPPLHPQIVHEILDIFHDADLTLIKEVLYFDGWSDYEENGGILVFKAIDDSIQIAHYGYSVMADDNTPHFYPLQEVTIEQANYEIQEIEDLINR